MCASAQKDTTKRQVVNIALKNGIFLGIEVWFRWLYAQKIKNLGTRGGFPRLRAQIIFFCVRWTSFLCSILSIIHPISLFYFLLVKTHLELEIDKCSVSVIEKCQSH